MAQDEIMREVRAIREGRAARHDFDVRALYEEAKDREEESERPVVHLEPRRIAKEAKGSE